MDGILYLHDQAGQALAKMTGQLAELQKELKAKDDEIKALRRRLIALGAEDDEGDEPLTVQTIDMDGSVRTEIRVEPGHRLVADADGVRSEPCEGTSDVVDVVGDTNAAVGVGGRNASGNR